MCLQVLKLHTKLGKPIPSTEPTVVASNSSTTTTAGKPAVAGTKTVTVKPSATTTIVGGTKKVLATPKITFVGGTQLKTTGVKAEDVKAETKAVITSQPSAEDEDGEFKYI